PQQQRSPPDEALRAQSNRAPLRQTHVHRRATRQPQPQTTGRRSLRHRAKAAPPARLEAWPKAAAAASARATARLRRAPKRSPKCPKASGDESTFGRDLQSPTAFENGRRRVQRVFVLEIF